MHNFILAGLFFFTKEPFLCFQSKKISIGLSRRLCKITDELGVKVDVGCDGTFLLVGITNPEHTSSKHVYFSGFEIIKYYIKDWIVDFLSLMGNNMSPTTETYGKKYTCFLSDRCKNFDNDKIEEETLLKNTVDSPNPFDYLAFRCVEKVCNEVEHFLIHLYYSDEVGDNDEDEDIWRTQRHFEQWWAQQETLFRPDFCNGCNEVVWIFNQKCVICLEHPSFFVFRLCGHQCLCEHC